MPNIKTQSHTNQGKIEPNTSARLKHSLSHTHIENQPHTNQYRVSQHIINTVYARQIDMRAHNPNQVGTYSVP